MSPTFNTKVLEKIKEDDVGAFSLLFSEYFQPLFIFAKKFVDEDLAKDFVQDCFSELWQNRKKIEIKKSLSAYLFTILKNRCYKHFQKEQSRFNHLSKLQFQLKQEEFNYFSHSEKSILEFDIRDRIHNTYKRLPEKCREVFMESRINGLSNKEIASKYQISVKAVENHITKALKIFKKEFKDIITLIVFLFQKN